MKNLLTSTLIILFATLMIAILPTDAEAKIYDDTLRLHILANSNESEDQKLKLEIRNRLLAKYGSVLKSADGISGAISSVGTILPYIKEDTEKWVTELGYDYSVDVTLTEEWYDTREYDGFTLPRGIYSSLQIIIGNGEGENWWCVMYPPMCLELATESAPQDDAAINYTKEEIKLISDKKYNVKFKILELLSDAFEKNG